MRIRNKRLTNKKPTETETREHARLREVRENAVPWRRWGPYLSERQGGHGRQGFRFRWQGLDLFTPRPARVPGLPLGEGGIAGICDEHMYLCFAWAFWNGRDPILKERMFGLTN